MSRRRRIDRALLALGGLVLVSSAVRFALSSGVDAPWIAPDEQLYGLLGRSLVAGDGLSVLGERIPYYSLVYPLLVGLPFVWSGLEDGVRTVQLLQALAMSLTAVPVFVWARPIAGARWALAAASLSVLIPGLVYSGLFMSEALYYLVATLAVWALASCLEGRRSCGRAACWVRWRLRRDATAGGRTRRHDPSGARSRGRRRAIVRALPAAPADDWSPRGRRVALDRHPGARAGSASSWALRTTGRGRRVLARRHRPVADVAGGRGSADHGRRPPRRARDPRLGDARADGRTTPVSVRSSPRRSRTPS